MTERFDHRDAAAREVDAAEETVIGSPIQDGAEEMREDAARADEKGEAEDGPDNDQPGDNDEAPDRS